MSASKPTLTKPTVDKIAFIMIFGGGTGDGGGWGLTPSGKLKRIPDNNPGLKKALAASRLLAAAQAMGNVAEARQIQDIATDMATKAATEMTAGT